MDRTQIVTAAIFAGVMAASPVAAPLRSAIFSKLARSPESQVGIDKIRADRAFARLQTPLQSEQSSELFQGLSYLLNDKYAAASPILGKYALLGDARAQSAIGAMYYAGMGFPIDRQEGIKWFQLAALQGGKAERDALLAAVNGTWQWDKTGSEPSYSASVIGDPAAQPNYNARSYPPADASVLSSAAAPNIQIPTLGARKSIDDAYGANSATKGSEGYRGASGARYRYDLSNPGDQVRYSVDPGAQLRDSISVDPKRDLDRSLGQYGGDIQP